MRLPGGDDDEGWAARLRAAALQAPQGTTAALAVRAAGWVALAAWTLSLLRGGRFGSAAESVLHLVNLPFHEAGHILFMPFGGFMTSLGGSLTQVLIPLVCAGTLLLRTGDPFGAAACTWWAGESLLDLAPYIADARKLELVLLGGYTGQEVEGHDWEAILGALGWLTWDERLGRLAFGVGALVMFASLAWAALLLVRHRRALEEA